MKIENMTTKEIELMARQQMHKMKDVGADWRDEWIKRNHSEMVRLITKGKNKGDSIITFDGNISLEELIGNGNPRKFLDTGCSCYFVKYLDWKSGSYRLGKAMDFTRHLDGSITVKVKTPEDFMLYGERTEEIEGIKAKRKYKRRTVGDSTIVNFNNILWALHPNAPQRHRGGKENHIQVLPGRRKGQPNNSEGKKGRGRKKVAQKPRK